MLVDYCSNCRRHKVIVDSILGLCADCAGRQTGPVVPPRRPPFKPELNPNPVDITTLKPRTNICKICRAPIMYGQVYCIDCFKKMPKGFNNSRKIGKHPTEKPEDPIDDFGQHVFAPETEEPTEEKGRDVFSIETPYLEVPKPDYTVDEIVINGLLASIKKSVSFDEFLLEIGLTAAQSYVFQYDDWIYMPTDNPEEQKSRLDTKNRVEQCKEFLRQHGKKDRNDSPYYIEGGNPLIRRQCEELREKMLDSALTESHGDTANEIGSKSCTADKPAETWENPDASDSL